ncbi:MAG: hypothetical protein A2W05_07545 [Candidatus Schekmanbacteria bacterium RBG_16_38_10]|uniref:Transposase IS200-like domain-containing protein n=1 Tax=Candidatus Schekmanbacteria bacterium RBG_16_38_10 TaxID=1817879 RepID=A0A1F7RPJ3_9BACT|nr:MAG: hypothetical protein A2W05_07545 [Candidatus Schekmanbacteria bacterium RBG_16_38_10]
MKYNPQQPHRRSIRLKGYDYSQAGAYFITICAYSRECIFGDVVNGIVKFLPIGKIAYQYWNEIPKHFKNVELDEFMVMPNHIHGIIVINSYVGVQNFEPLRKQNQFQHTMPSSIGSIIRTYKSAVTHLCKGNSYEHFKWQRNYYEHIIRDENDLYQIREYILNNPLKWELDEENPKNIKCKL